MAFDFASVARFVTRFVVQQLPTAAASAAATAVFGLLISYFQVGHTSAKAPAEQVQAAGAAEIEQLRSERALMLEAIRVRRLAEQEAAERMTEIKNTAESARAALKEPTSGTGATAKETAPLPPSRRVAQVSEPRREVNKDKPKPSAQPQQSVQQKPVDPLIIPPAAALAPAPESKGSVSTVLDAASGITRKAVGTVGDAISWVAGLPSSIFSAKDKVSGEATPHTSNGVIKATW